MKRRIIGPKIAHSLEKNEAHANIQDGIRVREVYDATMTGGQRAPVEIGRAAGNRDDSILVNERPRGAAWSARHPVKVEIVGSNPIGGALEMSKHGAVRKPAKRPSSNLGDLWVRLPLVSLSDGIDRRVVFFTAACKAVAIKK
jgi:hypothetical protein